MRDITEYKSVEATLRESAQRFRLLFQQSPLGKAVLGAERTIQEANPALCRMLGYTAEELRQRTFADMAHPEDHGRGTVAADTQWRAR